ncbi:hypothetical protein DFH09DRAFT_1369599 [Mycena vulgaris]|nr:hypothetical protein DFH09DRAFT_1369599 [Mycena vulgaris]
MIDRRWWAAFPGLTRAHYSILNSSCPDDSATLPRAYQRQCSPLDATMDWYCSALAVVSLSKGRPRTPPWLRTRLRSHRLPAAPRIPPRPHALLLYGVHPPASTHPPGPLRLCPRAFDRTPCSRVLRAAPFLPHTHPAAVHARTPSARAPCPAGIPPSKAETKTTTKSERTPRPHPPRLVPRDASRRCSCTPSTRVPTRKNLAAPRPLRVPHHPQRLETQPRARPLLPPPARSHPSAHLRLLVPPANEDERTCPCAVAVPVPFLSPLPLPPKRRRGQIARRIADDPLALASSAIVPQKTTQRRDGDPPPRIDMATVESE